MFPVMTLKLLAPPPESPNAVLPPSAAAMAAAVDWELIEPLLLELTATLPLGSAEAKLLSSALVLRLIVLLADRGGPGEVGLADTGGQ